MITLAVLSSALLGLTELPPQTYEKGRCRVFLWTRSEQPVRLAMLDEQARTLRLRRGKQMFDIAQIQPHQYGGHGYKVTLNLEYGQTGDLRDGTIIESGSARIELLQGGDSMVVPVGGIRSCG